MNKGAVTHTWKIRNDFSSYCSYSENCQKLVENKRTTQQTVITQQLLSTRCPDYNFTNKTFVKHAFEFHRESLGYVFIWCRSSEWGSIHFTLKGGTLNRGTGCASPLFTWYKVTALNSNCGRTDVLILLRCSMGDALFIFTR